MRDPIERRLRIKSLPSERDRVLVNALKRGIHARRDGMAFTTKAYDSSEYTVEDLFLYSENIKDQRELWEKGWQIEDQYIRRNQ